MFGALSTLPLYLQMVKGATPTESGLLLLPMMLGHHDRLDPVRPAHSRTGKYKIFPVIGTALMRGRPAAVRAVTVDTARLADHARDVPLRPRASACHADALLAVQNTVPATDMGVATSSATFFRQIGGTLGVAVFLSLLFSSGCRRLA